MKTGVKMWHMIHVTTTRDNGICVVIMRTRGLRMVLTMHNHVTRSSRIRLQSILSLLIGTHVHTTNAHTWYNDNHNIMG